MQTKGRRTGKVILAPRTQARGEWGGVCVGGWRPATRVRSGAPGRRRATASPTARTQTRGAGPKGRHSGDSCCTTSTRTGRAGRKEGGAGYTWGGRISARERAVARRRILDASSRGGGGVLLPELERSHLRGRIENLQSLASGLISHDQEVMLEASLFQGDDRRYAPARVDESQIKTQVPHSPPSPIAQGRIRPAPSICLPSHV